MPALMDTIRGLDDGKTKAKTGKTLKQWYSILDKWDLKKNGRTQAVKHLREKYQRVAAKESLHSSRRTQPGTFYLRKANSPVFAATR